jgi:hypothetical protein
MRGEIARVPHDREEVDKCARSAGDMTGMILTQYQICEPETLTNRR